jgi:hypothetical protein
MAIATEAEYDQTISEIKRPQMFTPPTSGRVNDWTPVLMFEAAGAAPLSLPKSLRVVRTYSSSRSDGLTLGRRFNAG